MATRIEMVCTCIIHVPVGKVLSKYPRLLPDILECLGSVENELKGFFRGC